jgi:hypothetical protein
MPVLLTVVEWYHVHQCLPPVVEVESQSILEGKGLIVRNTLRQSILEGKELIVRKHYISSPPH